MEEWDMDTRLSPLELDPLDAHPLSTSFTFNPHKRLTQNTNCHENNTFELSLLDGLQSAVDP